MPKPNPMPKVTSQLRARLKAEIKTGSTVYRIAKDAGVRPEVVAGFLRGTKDIRGETVDALCSSLGLVLISSAEATRPA